MKRAAYFLAAPALCLAVFWDVLFAWFLNDDFAWLGLWQDVHGAGDLFQALFQPQAQGTIRVLSERVFFLLGTAMFGIHAVPFRLVGLLTWFAVLGLASVIGDRLTGSRAAGLWAALFWTTSYALVLPLGWSSSFNQILCALLMLGAFYARLRGWRKTEWACYLAGFGALEIAVMYPAVAFLHSWWVERKRDKSALAMFVPAVLFMAGHLLLVPKNPGDIYTIRVDSQLPGTLLTYVREAVGPSRLGELGVKAWSSTGMATTWLCGLALLGFALWSLRKGDRVPVFGIAWLLLFLAPVLPLPNHITNYYLTLPLAGLAWVAGWGMVRAWRSNIAFRAASIVLAVAYLAGCAREDTLTAAWLRARAGRMRSVYRAVEQTAALHPGRAVMLQGVDNDLFQSGFQDNPFRLVGLERVYLTPGTAKNLVAREDLGGTTPFTLAAEDAAELIRRGELTVLDVGSAAPREITTEFAKVLEAEVAPSVRLLVDAGNPLHASALGPEWFMIEAGSRWMPRRATIQIAAPSAAGQNLYVTGYGAAAALTSGPVTLKFTVQGKEIGSGTVRAPDQMFSFKIPLGPDLIGRAPMTLAIEASKTFRVPGDSRELAMILKTFEVR